MKLFTHSFKPKDLYLDVILKEQVDVSSIFSKWGKKMDFKIENGSLIVDTNEVLKYAYDTFFEEIQQIANMDVLHDMELMENSGEEWNWDDDRIIHPFYDTHKTSVIGFYCRFLDEKLRVIVYPLKEEKNDPVKMRSDYLRGAEYYYGRPGYEEQVILEIKSARFIDKQLTGEKPKPKPKEEPMSLNQYSNIRSFSIDCKVGSSSPPNDYAKVAEALKDTIKFLPEGGDEIKKIEHMQKKFEELANPSAFVPFWWPNFLPL